MNNIEDKVNIILQMAETVRLVGPPRINDNKIENKDNK